MEQAQKQFVAGVIDYIRAYFPSNEVINCFNIFDPGNKMGQEAQDAALETLCTFYGKFKQEKLGVTEQLEPMIAQEEVNTEWELMKNILPHFSDCTMHEFYKTFLLPKKEAYPILAKLACLALTLPATSVECERGFS